MKTLPKSLIELLQLSEFRSRTAMYIGKNGISSLESFMGGYFYALEVNDIEVESDLKMNRFDDWIANYFGWTESTAGWKNIILIECRNDEEKAIHTFFMLFDKFIQKK